MNFILGAFIGSWTLARFMDLPVWPLRSWSNKCTQNEIQSLNKKIAIIPPKKQVVKKGKIEADSDSDGDENHTCLRLQIF